MKRFEGYVADIFFDRAMSWMKACKENNEPFFLYLPTRTVMNQSVLSWKDCSGKKWDTTCLMRGPWRMLSPETLYNIHDDPGHITDIMSTCIDVAGTVYPKEYNGNKIKPAPGLSLLPLLQAKKRDSHKPIFCEHFKSASVRWKHWKLVTLNYQDPQKWEVYNLNDDPCETQNLRAKFPEKTKELYELFLNWSRDVQVIPKPAPMLEKSTVGAEIRKGQAIHRVIVILDE